MRANLGFFAGFFQQAMSQVASTVGDEGSLRVGGRKRSVRWDARDAAAAAAAAAAAGGGGAGYFLVPPERALVPMSVYANLQE
jgi:hypothetical protein